LIVTVVLYLIATRAMNEPADERQCRHFQQLNFLPMMRTWREGIVRYRCGLAVQQLATIKATKPD